MLSQASLRKLDLPLAINTNELRSSPRSSSMPSPNLRVLPTLHLKGQCSEGICPLSILNQDNGVFAYRNSSGILPLYALASRQAYQIHTLNSSEKVYHKEEKLAIGVEIILMGTNLKKIMTQPWALFSNSNFVGPNLGYSQPLFQKIVKLSGMESSFVGSGRVVRNF